MSIGYLTVDNQRRTQSMTDYGLLFPGLLDEINHVVEITVTTFQNSYSLALVDGSWRVSAFENYPAELPAIADFLIRFAQLRKIDMKTNDPEKFAALDLMGPGQVGSPTVMMELLAAENRVLAGLLIGKRRTSVQSAPLTEFYVRKPDENQTWLVESSMRVPADAEGWLDTEIIDLDERVQKVTMQPVAERPFVILRESPEHTNFLLMNVPENHKIRHQFRLNDIGNLFHRLKFADVKKVADWGTGIEVSVQTFDDLKIMAKFGSGEKRNFVRFTAQVLPDAESKIKAEAERLNRKWRGWMYQISDVRRETAELTVADLVAPTT